MSNVLDAISKLKLKKQQKSLFYSSLILPAYSYTGIWNFIRNNL